MAMLRSPPQEQYRYFCIDRKFGSGNLQQINDALDEIDLFMGKMKKIDLINSLVMRMLELILNPKYIQLKHRVANIFKHHKNTLLKIHNKQEIANALAKNIKASDQFTRIICLQMIGSLDIFFLKDIAVYHNLLAKISMNNSLSKAEKKEVIICLSIILSNSRQIAKLFCKNITQLQKLYCIPLHIILYLLTHVVMDSHLQRQILEELRLLVQKQNEVRSNQKLKRRQIHYFEKLVLNYASHNYRILQYYELSRLREQLPRLQSPLNKIKNAKYSFLISDDRCQMKEGMNENFVQNLQPFIDELYIKKSQGNLLNEYQEKIDIILDDNLVKNSDNFENVILLLYFVEDNISRYDRNIKRKITQKLLVPSKQIFKKLLAVGCFQSALLVLNSIQIPQTNYLFLRVFLQFKAQKEPKKLDQLKQITQVLNKDLFTIVKCWQIIQKMLRISLASSKLPNELVHELNSLFNSIKNNNIFPELVEVIAIFTQNKNFENVAEMQRKCYHLLPSFIMHNHSYWFAHINKKSIITFFNFVL